MLAIESSDALHLEAVGLERVAVQLLELVERSIYESPPNGRVQKAGRFWRISREQLTLRGRSGAAGPAAIAAIVSFVVPHWSRFLLV